MKVRLVRMAVSAALFSAQSVVELIYSHIRWQEVAILDQIEEDLFVLTAFRLLCLVFAFVIMRFKGQKARSNFAAMLPPDIVNMLSQKTKSGHQTPIIQARRNIMKALKRITTVGLFLSLAVAGLCPLAVGQSIVKENLGTNVNSEYSDLLPVISADGHYLYFIRRGDPANTGGAYVYYGGEATEHSDIWYCERTSDGQWSTAQNAGSPLNTINHDAICSLSPDGNSALVGNIYLPDGSQGAGFSISRKTEHGWSHPDSLHIENYYNLNQFMNACLANDGRTLVLSIEQHDGLGDLDLYASFLLSENRRSEPQNLGETINSSGSDATPFMASDGMTLYFASNGHHGYGSHDMFVSKRLDSTWTRWSEPRNLGPEINTPGWDAYYTIPASGEWAYFVSAVQGGYGRTDIYRVSLPDSLRPKPVVLVRGKVTGDSAQPMEANITYGRLGSGKVMGKATTNPQTGEYSITFPFEEWYGQQDTIWYSFYFNRENYLPVHKNLDLRKREQRYQEIEMDVVLQPIVDPYAAGRTNQAPQEIVLENVFFDLNKHELRPESFEQLSFLADSLMSRYPSLEVIIAGHTDNTGSEDHNLELSQHRAEAVIGYLVERGITRHRFQAQWFGATKPVATNDTEEGRQKNRRVTFQISRFEPLGMK